MFPDRALRILTFVLGGLNAFASTVALASLLFAGSDLGQGGFVAGVAFTVLTGVNANVLIWLSASKVPY